MKGWNIHWGRRSLGVVFLDFHPSSIFLKGGGIFVLIQFTWWLRRCKYACHAGDENLISGLGRSLREGNDNPLQCSCLENPVGRRAWWAAVQSRKESETTERLTLWLFTSA